MWVTFYSKRFAHCKSLGNAGRKRKILQGFSQNLIFILYSIFCPAFYNYICEKLLYISFQGALVPCAGAPIVLPNVVDALVGPAGAPGGQAASKML